MALVSTALCVCVCSIRCRWCRGVWVSAAGWHLPSSSFPSSFCTLSVKVSPLHYIRWNCVKLLIVSGRYLCCIISKIVPNSLCSAYIPFECQSFSVVKNREHCLWHPFLSICATVWELSWITEHQSFLNKGLKISPWHQHITISIFVWEHFSLFQWSSKISSRLL